MIKEIPFERGSSVMRPDTEAHLALCIGLLTGSRL
jgi:hypothetical protein